MVGSQPMHILIDSGSTHNFLDVATAKKLRCELLKITPLVVVVANGAQLQCQMVCRGLKWSLGDMDYVIDNYIVPLGSCDMILGVQWLATLGSIIWDFEKLTMEFVFKGRRQFLEGQKNEVVRWAAGAEQKLFSHAVQMFAIHIDLVPLETISLQSAGKEQRLEQLLQEYAGIFEEPKTLLPHRSHDHRIILKEGTSPINVRPYRYPPLQKDIIEQTIKEMSETRVVKPSQSPYSSSIVLVKKKDGTWRLCMDYRQLNKHTALDRFPIPMVEELLDELCGAAYFSKIDLRSRYWQVRMFPADIPKIAFRTHEGHYELLVMPFGLTNTPSTFQALMNHIFKPYLRSFLMISLFTALAMTSRCSGSIPSLLN